jgi:hypothetical protein
MALIGRHNIVMVKSSTTGTGTLTLTTAVRGFLTFALGGVANGERVSYTIRDGADTEVGLGTYTAAGTTLTRDIVRTSTNGGSKIACTGRQLVEISLHSEDITPFAKYGGYTSAIADATTDEELTLAETVDDFGLGSAAANIVTLAQKGQYMIFVYLYVAGVGTFDGTFEFTYYGHSLKRGYVTAWGIDTDDNYWGPIIYDATADADAFGHATFTNNLGVEVDAAIDVFFVKVGNT